MYTRCPHCTTIFRITAEQLRLTHGDLPCVTCAKSFNVLDSLADDVTTLITAPDIINKPEDESAPQDEIPAEAEADPEASVSSDTDQDGYSPDSDLADNDSVLEADDDDDDDEMIRDDIPAEIDLDEIDADRQEEAEDDPDLTDTGLAHDFDENLEYNEPDDDETIRDKIPAEIDPDEIDADRQQEAEDDLALKEPEKEDENDPDLADMDSDDDADENPDHDDQLLETTEPDTPEQTWTRTLLTTDAIASLEQANLQSDLEAESDSHSPSAELPTANDSVYQPWIDEADTDAESLEFQTADKDEWQRFLAELSDNNSATPAEDEDEDQIIIDDPEPEDPESEDPEPEDPEPEDPEQFGATEALDEAETVIIPAWLEDENTDNASAQHKLSGISWRKTGICVALALLLAGQLIHYNRDALATDPTYGGTIRVIYELFNTELYPDWPLEAFEITGTEAIAGRVAQNALDVHAKVVVRGQHPIGLPLIRIVLRDRWANPVASRVFTPGEYLHTYDAKETLVKPGTIFPVKISVADPGAEALGYVVDICLPRRKSGLECQIIQDPFQ